MEKLSIVARAICGVGSMPRAAALAIAELALAKKTRMPLRIPIGEVVTLFIVAADYSVKWFGLLESIELFR